MAIKLRRGAYADFDPSKMDEAELAVVQSGDPSSDDGKAAYLAFAPGQVKRLATHEDIQNEIAMVTQDIATNLTQQIEAAVADDLEAAQTAATNAGTSASAASTKAHEAAESAAQAAQTVANIIDNTLTQTGKAADAKKVGDEIDSLKGEKVDKQQAISDAGKALIIDIDGVLRPSEITEGLTNEAKSALLACFRHVSWLDDDEDYYAALELALDVEPERSLSVVFEPGNYIVYANDSLDTLIPYLTVTYYEGSTGTVLSSDDYSLSGSLQIGSNTIDVSYTNLIASFNVTAIDFYNIFTRVYDPNGESNMEISYTSMFDSVVTVSGVEKAYGVFTNKEPSNPITPRRSLYVTRGKAPARIGTSAPTSKAKEGFYPIPVPATARKLTFTPTPSTIQTSIYLGKYIGTDPSDVYQYERINYVYNHVAGVQTVTWTPQSDLFVWFLIRKDSNNSNFTENPKFVINFE